MNARDEILARIRQATGGLNANRAADYTAIRRDYRIKGDLGSEDRVHLFIDRLQDYEATVYRCDKRDISAAIGRAMRARQKKALLIPTEFPSGWLPPDFRFIPDAGLTFHEIDNSEGVLTGCALAIAMTGTIVLRHSAGQGRRALTLIPDYHLCVVSENQVVETVAAGIRMMSEFGNAPLTAISGPSATADIEMTRIKGVHGPRTLDVILAR